MNDLTIIIVFKEGTIETIKCLDYEVKNNCLSVSLYHKKTRVIPLDNIKEFTFY